MLIDDDSCERARDGTQLDERLHAARKWLPSSRAARLVEVPECSRISYIFGKVIEHFRYTSNGENCFFF